MDPTFASSAGTKRSREDDGDEMQAAGLLGKKQRPTLDGVSHSWHHDSVLNTPLASSQHPKYDSDDQSSMVSEPGSPQDMASSGDEMDLDESPSFSQSPEDRQHTLPKASPASSSPWRDRLQGRNRIATPFHRPSMRPAQLQTAGFKQHVRQRHPQENSSDLLEVPSPIDEDEVPTPPSAAEAAGSQLSMLSMDDMDVEQAGIPAITVDPARSIPIGGETSRGAEAMDRAPEPILVRKQRQRSGATSNGSASPARGIVELGMDSTFGGSGRKGISIGYRADCEKCRMRVPGHMNHFVT
ncbi:hypothetical protein B0A50_01320 [Salinomyces thailandicus]|uniref:Uncharacterized protein n=1 Tax=Salinomyces thailandicus TaxID=706561 RepID=A0A4U0U9Q5_9PEZI|nr:hypothetical protein B0A50_01320 [Salinomyces thailandica]